MRGEGCRRLCSVLRRASGRDSLPTRDSSRSSRKYVPYSAFAGRPQHSAQNLSSKNGGASGLGVRDRIECGHADCPSVSPGVAVSGESDIGGFFGGSTTVCGRCNLRVAGLILLLGALAACFGISAGGIGRVSGAYPSSSSPSPVKFTGSNHWKMLTFRSSIAAHPVRPKPADKVKETSATRAQPPNWYSPSVARDGRVTPHGCRGVN